MTTKQINKALNIEQSKQDLINRVIEKTEVGQLGELCTAKEKRMIKALVEIIIECIGLDHKKDNG